jgi:hypothetical protein
MKQVEHELHLFKKNEFFKNKFIKNKPGLIIFGIRVFAIKIESLSSLSSINLLIDLTITSSEHFNVDGNNFK